MQPELGLPEGSADGAWRPNSRGELHQFAPNGGPNTAISPLLRRIALVFGFVLIYRATT